MAASDLNQLLRRVRSELEKAALILACEANTLKQIGHAKSEDVDKIRSKLNAVIRSIKTNGTRSDSA